MLNSWQLAIVTLIILTLVLMGFVHAWAEKRVLNGGKGGRK